MKIDEAKNKFLTFCQIEKGLTSITIEDYRLDFLNSIFICIGEMKIDRKMPIFVVFSHNICDI